MSLPQLKKFSIPGTSRAAHHFDGLYLAEHDARYFPDRSPVGRFPDSYADTVFTILTLTIVYINLHLSVLILREHLFC